MVIRTIIGMIFALWYNEKPKGEQKIKQNRY